MRKLVFYLHSTNKSFSLEIDNNLPAAWERYIELISIFWIVLKEKIEVPLMILMDDNIRQKYNEYISKYKEEKPILNRFKSALDTIENGEYFYTSPKAEYNAEESVFIGNLIKVYNSETKDEARAKLFEKLLNQQDDIFGDLLKNYDLKVFDSSKKMNIGESNRQLRICRFCHNGMNTNIKVKFRKKAHAFSESLGNKAIVLHEECDICNEKFGSTIENDFIQYLGIFRVFYKVKGKNGIPKIKYKDGGSIQHIIKENLPKDDLVSKVEGLTVVTAQNIEHNEETGELTVILESPHKLQEINIYKTLCKYVLSVIDDSELQYLQSSIDWINSDIIDEEVKLPKIATLLSPELYVDAPVLGVYVRKDNDYSIPHIVAEFKFKSLIFVFLLPFSTKDENDFINPASYEKFWKTFKHYSSIKTWKFQEFSCAKAKKIRFRMKMIQGNKS